MFTANTLTIPTLAAVSVIAGLSSLGNANAQNNDESVIQIEPIRVTANKRDQDLSEIDGAVQVKTAEELEQANVTKVSDLERVFPGLVIETRGNRAYENVSLRGVTSPDFYNPAIQVYVDGVPQDASYFTQELVNIDRVELLSGPQGTLYGRNAHGGVINIVTNPPGNEPRASASTSYATGGRSATLSAAHPIAPDKLYADIDLRWSNEFGRVDDTTTGDHNIDDTYARMGKLGLRYAPTGGPWDVSATVKREVMRSHEELYLREAVLGELLFDSATQGGLPVVDRRVDTYALNAKYDFGWGSLVSTTAFQDRDMERVLNGTNFPENQDTFSEELRLSFVMSEKLDGVVGVYAQDSEFVRVNPGFAGFTGSSVNNVDTRSYAVFGEATYALSDHWDVTGGMRFSREEAEVDFSRQAPAGFSFTAEETFNDISPKVSLGWQISPHHRLYTTVSRGFKPGGFNHAVSSANDVVPYESETSTNIELGWRSGVLGGVAQFTAALYWIESQDTQIFVGPLGSQVLRNVGDAVSRGVEANVTLFPTQNLTLNLGAQLGKSEFVDTVDPLTGTDSDGNTLPYAPDHILTATMNYVVPQSIFDGVLSANMNGRYVSRTFFDQSNTLSQDGYSVFGASIDLAMDNGATVKLFADNLTDELYRTSSFDFGGGDIRSSINKGRSVGVQLRMDL